MILKRGNKYVIKSHTGKTLGSYSSKGAAEKRLAQIEYFKNQHGKNVETIGNKAVASSPVSSQEFDSNISHNVKMPSINKFLIPPETQSFASSKVDDAAIVKKVDFKPRTVNYQGEKAKAWESFHTTETSGSAYPKTILEKFRAHVNSFFEGMSDVSPHVNPVEDLSTGIHGKFTETVGQASSNDATTNSSTPLSAQAAYKNKIRSVPYKVSIPGMGVVHRGVDEKVVSTAGGTAYPKSLHEKLLDAISSIIFEDPGMEANLIPSSNATGIHGKFLDRASVEDHLTKLGYKSGRDLHHLDAAYVAPMGGSGNKLTLEKSDRLPSQTAKTWIAPGHTTPTIATDDSEMRFGINVRGQLPTAYDYGHPGIERSITAASIPAYTRLGVAGEGHPRALSTQEAETHFDILDQGPPELADMSLIHGKFEDLYSYMDSHLSPLGFTLKQGRGETEGMSPAKWISDKGIVTHHGESDWSATRLGGQNAQTVKMSHNDANFIENIKEFFDTGSGKNEESHPHYPHMNELWGHAWDKGFNPGPMERTKFGLKFSYGNGLDVYSGPLHDGSIGVIYGTCRNGQICTPPSMPFKLGEGEALLDEFTKGNDNLGLQHGKKEECAYCSGHGKNEDGSPIEKMEYDPKILRKNLLEVVDNYKIMEVDGGAVRDNLDIDFLGGSNCYACPQYVPEGEVWVEKGISDQKALIEHELSEAKMMAGGASYHDAHTQAEEIERKYRNKDK